MPGAEKTLDDTAIRMGKVNDNINIILSFLDGMNEKNISKTLKLSLGSQRCQKIDGAAIEMLQNS